MASQRLTSSTARVRVVRLRVRDVRRRSGDDVDGRGGGDLVARPGRRDHDRALGQAPQPLHERGRERVGSVGLSGVQLPEPVHGDREHEQARGERAERPPLLRPLAREDDAEDERDGAGDQREPRDLARPALAQAVGEVSGPLALEREPRQRARTGSTQTERATSASPPAKANANGTKPAARRDCESETAFEKRTKSSGTSISASTATVPPRTNAPQRRRAAKHRERHQGERRNRDRTGAARHLRREAEVVHRLDDELTAVVGERRRLQPVGRVHGQRLVRRAAAARAPRARTGTPAAASATVERRHSGAARPRTRRAGSARRAHRSGGRARARRRRPRSPRGRPRRPRQRR